MKKYCGECGSEMQPRANQTHFSEKTGKPLFALWLWCLNKNCPRYRAGVPTGHLAKSDASEAEANRWQARHKRTPDEKPAGASFMSKLLAAFRQVTQTIGRKGAKRNEP